MLFRVHWPQTISKVLIWYSGVELRQLFGCWLLWQRWFILFERLKSGKEHDMLPNEFAGAVTAGSHKLCAKDQTKLAHDLVPCGSALPVSPHSRHAATSHTFGFCSGHDSWCVGCCCCYLWAWWWRKVLRLFLGCSRIGFCCCFLDDAVFSYFHNPNTQVFGWPIPRVVFQRDTPTGPWLDYIGPTIVLAYPMNFVLFMFFPSVVFLVLALRRRKRIHETVA